MINGVMMSVSITELKTNRIKNPLGYNLGESPSFSWIVECTTAKIQDAARVQVALDCDFSHIISDSNKDNTISSICYKPKIDLLPRTRYYWRVKIWAGGAESDYSEPSWFETSKMDEAWHAKWISPEFDKEIHPKLFCDIQLSEKVKSARAYACGLGLYEISINESKISDELLSPGLTAYDKWIPYQTYDITDALSEGKNNIEVMLGNGWYKGRYGLNRSKRFQYGDKFAVICEIIVEYESGKTEIFSTDENLWKARKSNIISSGIFDGEVCDDTFLEDTIYATLPIEIDITKLEPRRSPPIIVKEKIKPIEIIHTPAGEIVLDMGQNMVGWLEFENHAPKNYEIMLQFGEVLQDGNFYRDNLRTALCEYKYTSDGKSKKVRPHFTFYGFRYVKLTKWEGEVNLDDFCGCVMYSDIEQTGKITTDNELINRLFLNALWGQKGNYLDVPTDCPQRDERMGWTGDAQVFFGTAAFNMDVYAFFDKFCYDLMREQKARGGNVPVVVPAHDVEQNGSCAWGDASVIIPWGMYIRYGDISILEQQYESMTGWIDFIKSRDEAAGGRRLWTNDFHYGDWLSLDGDDSENRFGGTEKAYIASAYYRYSSGIVAKAAKLLGKEEDAKYYTNLSEEVKSAIQKEYFTASGRLAINTQTAHVVALYMDLVEEENKERIAYDLRCKLKESQYHLRTGFVGTPYLCKVLSDNGSNDISYRLLMNKDFPSWLYQITMGATTIWERWNSILPDGKIGDTGMNSLNHYSYGSIVEWMYSYMAGIKPIEDAPGFREFKLEPQPNNIIKSVEAEYKSPFGKIVSRWKVNDDGLLEFYFKVPFNTTAKLKLPDAEGTEYEEIINLYSGKHTFSYMPKKNYNIKFDIDSSIQDIYANDEAREVVKRYIPKISKFMLFEMFAGERSVLDFIKQGLAVMDEKTQEKLNNRLMKIK